MSEEREILYTGENSIIYLETKGGKALARKVLRSEFPTPDQILNFNNELEYTQDLKLKGVRQVISKERIQNKHSLLLDFVDGVTLKEAFVDKRRTLKESLDLFIKITDSLIDIHKHGIIHKDINTNNILWVEETKQPVIIDFGISTRLNLKSHHLGNPDKLQGTLAFMPPEQTGRVNRKVDNRSDLYSLGVSFYQVLTGKLPFEAKDSLEMVHFQIAKTPAPVVQGNHNIPKVVSLIVAKLLEKDAENRYQSASGLNEDLKRCQKELQEKGSISLFELGEFDFSSRFEIPQKLYGRSKETETLLKAFERVGKGSTELFLVDGYSGVGKSALISELYKPITAMRGYFISGKFDQYQHNVPYFGITQAFEEFCELLLTETPESLEVWKTKILKAVGESGSVLIDLIPGLEKIIGAQPEVPSLLAQEAKNRFTIIFQSFIRVISQADHPFVLFVDDLQWADIGSLNLIKQLVADIENPYFLVIGAYRNNEIGPGHSLPKILKSAKESGAVINEIHLKPLNKKDVSHLIEDTFKASDSVIQKITEIVFTKTQGNAFFTREFIKSIYYKGHIKFNPDIKGWEADLDEIEQMQVSENVVDLMVSKIKELPTSSEHVLKLASCIGGLFALDILAEINNKSKKETLTELWVAVNEHLIRPVGDAYKYVDIDVKNTPSKIEFEFSHDRIQQAAYSLLKKDQQKKYHLQIAKILREKYKDEEVTFDVVNQFNAGQDLIKTKKEKFELAELNLNAAIHARDSGANEAALDYIMNSQKLVEELNLSKNYEFEKTLFISLAEIQFLNGRVEESMAQIEKSIDFVKTDDEKSQLYAMLMRNLSLINQLPESIETARKGLKVLGFDLPDNKCGELIPVEMGKVLNYFSENKIEKTHERERMTDPRILSIMRILDYLSEPSYVSGETDLWILHVLYKVNLTNQYGITPQGGYAFTELGLIFFILGNYQYAYPAALEAKTIVEMFGDESPKHLSRVGHLFTNYNTPWVKHIKETLDLNSHFFQVSLDTGELVFTGYLNFFNYCSAYYWGNSPTSDFLGSIDGDIALGRKINMALSYNSLTGLKLNLAYLSNQTVGRKKYSFDLKGLSEAHFLEECAKIHDFYSITCFHVFKAQSLMLTGAFKEAAEESEKVIPLAAVISGMVAADGTFRFIHGLSLLRLARENPKKKEEFIEKADAYINQFKIWSDNCIPNFSHKYFLLQAEKNALLENHIEAIENYNLAIESASKHEFDREAALAHKLTGEYWFRQGRMVYAKPHIAEAHYLFNRLGYTKASEVLSSSYPELLSSSASRLETKSSTKSTLIHSDSTTQIGNLDYLSIVKASQAFSSEIQLDKLLVKMLNIVIENAGGQRASLLLQRNRVWSVEAEFDVENNELEVLHSKRLEESTDIPKSIINFVLRSGKEVFSSDETHAHIFERDAYLLERKPASFMVLPLKYQGQIKGILYVEHFESKAAFTEKGKGMLRFLSNQMAVSIDNASLYENMSKLSRAYQRFVPYEFINALGRGSILDVQLGDQIHQDMNVMFCDIRSFSRLAESMTPEENFNFINAYLKRVGPIIKSHGGFINHYFGDGFIALFKDSTRDAVQAALDIFKEIGKYNIERVKRKWEPIQIGVGLHTGEVMMGIIGDEERHDANVISDSVNTASRIEGLTKIFNSNFIISQSSFNNIEIDGDFNTRFLGKVKVKGKDDVLPIYEVYDADEPDLKKSKKSIRKEYKNGVDHYLKREFEKALLMFAKVRQRIPDDYATNLYLKRCIEYSNSVIPDDWEGVEEMTEK